MPRRARRILLSLSLWLLLGAAINVLLAWLAVFATRNEPWWVLDTNGPPTAISRFTTSDDWPPPFTIMYHPTFWHDRAWGGLPVRLVPPPQLAEPPGPESRPLRYAYYTCAGAPFRSLLGWVPSTNYFTPAAARYKSPVLWVIRPGPPTASGNLRMGQGLFLPIRPLWPGFALNAAFYALLAFLFTRFIAAPITRKLRHHLRARRGRCPHCAYSLAGIPPSAPCPECGRARAALPVRTS